MTAMANTNDDATIIMDASTGGITREQANRDIVENGDRVVLSYKVGSYPNRETVAVEGTYRGEAYRFVGSRHVGIVVEGDDGVRYEALYANSVKDDSCGTTDRVGSQPVVSLLVEEEATRADGGQDLRETVEQALADAREGTFGRTTPAQVEVRDHAEGLELVAQDSFWNAHLSHRHLSSLREAGVEVRRKEDGRTRNGLSRTRAIVSGFEDDSAEDTEESEEELRTDGGEDEEDYHARVEFTIRDTRRGRLLVYGDPDTSGLDYGAATDSDKMDTIQSFHAELMNATEDRLDEFENRAVLGVLTWENEGEDPAVEWNVGDPYTDE